MFRQLSSNEEESAFAFSAFEYGKTQDCISFEQDPVYFHISIT